MALRGSSISKFQSTLPRGERPQGGWRLDHGQVVSIHAPAGGATATSASWTRKALVSIHAPAGGATGVSVSRDLVQIVSIHAPAGGATAAKQRANRPEIFVSIHAPAGGAT